MSNLKTLIGMFIVALFGVSLAASIVIEYWQFFAIFGLVIILIFVICKIAEPTEPKPDVPKYRQEPILPMTADEAERSVLDAIRKKVVYYQNLLEDHAYTHRLFGDNESISCLERDLRQIRKDLKSVGRYKDGGYYFCWFPGEPMRGFDLRDARDLHYSTYFNGKCEEIIKKYSQDGLEEIKSQITLFSDFMLNELRVELKQDYIALKLREVEIRYHIARLKDEQKQKEQEERKAQRDYERALKDAARNEESARAQLDKQREALEKAATEQEKAKLQDKVSELENKLQEALTMKERAMSMAQQTRTGYVYVISNVRSFGEGVYKIGMTRRLDPMDRVRELGDASVPFPFDVHHMIYTDDAPKLEAQLHQRFAEQKMNNDNYRKEFFRVPLEEIEAALRELEVIDKEKELG